MSLSDTQYALEGGSFGLQVGGEASDLILLVFAGVYVAGTTLRPDDDANEQIL
jgi:lipid-binding SYLF domain-containing protein